MPRALLLIVLFTVLSPASHSAAAARPQFPASGTEDRLRALQAQRAAMAGLASRIEDGTVLVDPSGPVLVATGDFSTTLQLEMVAGDLTLREAGERLDVARSSTARTLRLLRDGLQDLDRQIQALRNDPGTASPLPLPAVGESVIAINPPSLPSAPLPLPPVALGASEAARRGDGTIATAPGLRGDLHDIRMEVVPAPCGERVRIQATVTNTGSEAFFPASRLRLFTVIDVDRRQRVIEPRFDTVEGSRPRMRLRPGESTVLIFETVAPEVQPFDVRVELRGGQVELLDSEERTFEFPAPNLRLVPGWTQMLGTPESSDVREKIRSVSGQIRNSGQRATRGTVSISAFMWRQGPDDQLVWQWSQSTDESIAPGRVWSFTATARDRPTGRRPPVVGSWRSGEPDWDRVYFRVHNECDTDYDHRDNHAWNGRSRSTP